MNLADPYRTAYVPLDERHAWLDRESRLRVTSWGRPVPAWVGLAALALQMALLVLGVARLGEAVAPLLCFSASAIGLGANLRFRRESSVAVERMSPRAVTTYAPKNGDVLRWNDGNSQWSFAALRNP